MLTGLRGKYAQPSYGLGSLPPYDLGLPKPIKPVEADISRLAPLSYQRRLSLPLGAVWGAIYACHSQVLKLRLQASAGGKLAALQPRAKPPGPAPPLTPQALRAAIFFFFLIIQLLYSIGNLEAKEQHRENAVLSRNNLYQYFVFFGL